MAYTVSVQVGRPGWDWNKLKRNKPTVKSSSQTITLPHANNNHITTSQLNKLHAIYLTPCSQRRPRNQEGTDCLQTVFIWQSSSTLLITSCTSCLSALAPPLYWSRHYTLISLSSYTNIWFVHSLWSSEDREVIWYFNFWILLQKKRNFGWEQSFFLLFDQGWI